MEPRVRLLPGALLLAIADRCPVHATLTHELKVRTRLVP